MSVERTVVVGLPQQGLDGEKNGADLRNIKLDHMNDSLYYVYENPIRFYLISLCESLNKRLKQSDLLLNTSCGPMQNLCHDIHLVQSRPLLLEYVEADVSVSVHVRVEAGG